MTILSAALLALVAIPVAYLCLLALGALRRPPLPPPTDARIRFGLAVPAHDEETVIGRTVAGLRSIAYPAELFDVWVVADCCSDHTAERARVAGATCLERGGGLEPGKGAALGWLFARIREEGVPYDAMVVFDADTQVDAGFLQAIAARLSQGEQAVQGQHRVVNPGDGWYPALSDAMFRLNNRIFNQGRVNLALSAMNMGDSICLRSDLLRDIGWGEGLTEDYDLRLRLLLCGVRIAYEPAAVGYGEAPQTWAAARRQRERWLVGVHRSGRAHLGSLVRQAARRPNALLLDGIARIVLPSYSTLTLLTAAGLVVQVGLAALGWVDIPAALLWAWLGILVLLVAYPFFGLALDRAPRRAFAAALTGPAFVLWRTWLALLLRLGGAANTWVRTPRRRMR